MSDYWSNRPPYVCHRCNGSGRQMYGLAGREKDIPCLTCQQYTFVDVSDYEVRERGRYNKRYDLHPTSREWDEGAL